MEQLRERIRPYLRSSYKTRLLVKQVVRDHPDEDILLDDFAYRNMFPKPDFKMPQVYMRNTRGNLVITDQRLVFQEFRYRWTYYLAMVLVFAFVFVLNQVVDNAFVNLISLGLLGWLFFFPPRFITQLFFKSKEIFDVPLRPDANLRLARGIKRGTLNTVNVKLGNGNLYQFLTMDIIPDHVGQALLDVHSRDQETIPTPTHFMP
jgi:hypothetical protein